MSDTYDEEERPTEAVSVPWGSGGYSLDEFDPETFDASAVTDPSASGGFVTDELVSVEVVNGELVSDGSITSEQATDERATDDRITEDRPTDDEQPSIVVADPFGHLTTGTQVGGRYKLEKILGRGACGVVFQAEHMVIGKKVALKCLYPMLRSHPVQVERFFREARIAATIDHPNVIKIFDGGDDPDTLFLVMELLEGETLGQRLERGRMPLAQAKALFLVVADGVAAMHDRGVVHRDLKPDNVFLTVDRDGNPGDPRVLDFGISKLKEPGRRDLTALGTVMGTPFYMAPEQMLNAKGVDQRADVYSLGIMLYEAISGQLPYDGDNITDIFTKARGAKCLALNSLAPHVAAEFSQVVAKAMQVDPDQRHKTVRELMHAIEHTRLESGIEEGITLESASPPARPSRPTPERPPPPAQPIAEVQIGAMPGLPAPSPVRLGSLPTRALVRPAIRPQPAVPIWAIVAMLALAMLSLASIVVAIVAISI